MSSSENSVFIGLKSGGVLTITRHGPADIEVSGTVRFDDLASGLSGENRFGSQLYRSPYTVAEHSVLGSYLLDNPIEQLQFMIHDGHEGVGGLGDINGPMKKLFLKGAYRIADAVDEFIAQTFNIPYPFSEEVHRIDKALGNLEILLLHPAKGAMLGKYGKTREEIESQFTAAQLTQVRQWLGGSALSMDQAKDVYVQRWRQIQHAIAENLAVQETVRQAVTFPDSSFWPHPEKTIVADLANPKLLPWHKVQDEVTKYMHSGRLVRVGEKLDFLAVNPQVPV